VTYARKLAQLVLPDDSDHWDEAEAIILEALRHERERCRLAVASAPDLAAAYRRIRAMTDEEIE
jgi:hypothetical protein